MPRLRIRRDDLRQLIESDGARTAELKILDMIKEANLSIDDISLRTLFEGLVGDVSTHLAYAQHQEGFVDMREAAGVAAVGSSLFPTITGVLISNKVMTAYNGYPHIGDQVTTRIPSTRKVETFVGFTEVDEVEEVKEGMPYPETGFGERKWTATTAKYGRIISITEEAIYYDETGELIRRATSIGEKAMSFKEKLILKTIQDSTGFAAFNPEGVNEALWRSGAGTNSKTINIVSSNALVDYTDIQALLLAFAALTDGRGERIGIPGRLQLVTPFALSMTANKILNATEHRETPGSTTRIGAPPRELSAIQPLSSVLLDDVSTTSYYFGDLQGQFYYLEVWPMQVLRRAQGSEAQYRNDVTFQLKVRFLGGVGIIDDKKVLKSTP